MEIGIAKRTFVDGSAGANNPVHKLREEMQDLMGYDHRLEDNLNCLVSLGAGIKSLKPFDQTSGALSNTLMAIATETERSAQQFQRSKANLFRESLCYRFSAPSVGDLGMNRPEDRGVIEQMTDRYVEDKSTWSQLQQCAATMSRRKAKDSGLANLQDRQLQLVKSGLWSMVRSTWTVNGLPFNIFDSISRYDRERALRQIRNRKISGTTRWIVEEPQFQRWLNSSNGSLLLLNRIIGSGKTLCMATAIDYLQELDTSKDPQLFHYVFEMATPNCRDGTDALNALIKQMILLNPQQEGALRSDIYLYYGPTTHQPSFSEVWQYVFLPLIRASKAPNLVVDGLDLCQASSLTTLMRSLISATNIGARVLVSARGRESEALKRLRPELSEIKISKDISGRANDLKLVVKRIAQSKREQKNITSDHMFMTVQSELLNRIGVM
ncbi:hypothetical protein B9Z65_5073 [Elsinoe australis]|uniref:Nephrocystin 3-like N-terminal domain-containing protein n=1 Tax=Elsinoe australis TaxID=40998 RepID=A0A2P7ZCZ8_9PEZI|nr:hypothetical protein B9Z65_5073 [Elsinoe australis]